MNLEKLRNNYYEWQRKQNEKLFIYFSKRSNKIKNFFSKIFLSIDLSLCISFAIFLIIFFGFVFYSIAEIKTKIIMAIVLGEGFYISILRIIEIWKEIFKSV